MPRNSGGTYSLPSGNPVVAGTTIEAAWANNTLSDVGNELTNSLSRQGTGGMLAALRLADGSVTVPGLAFVSETTTGFYRAASNDMRMAILGSDVWAATSSAFTISKAVTLSVASNLGTPSALTLTNATGLPLTTGVTGTLPVANGGTGITAFGTGVATALGQNVTGSGGIVLATSPTLTTPNLGTPSAVTLTNATGLPIATGVSGLGTGVATALAVNTGSSGAFVVNGGALGTPSSGTVTNLTGTASININGTVGATTPTTGAFTTLSASGAVTLSGGTANGVLYLNGSKVATSGSALTFDGTTLTSAVSIKTGGGAASNSARLMVNTPNGSAAGIQLFQDAQESWIMEVPVSSTALRWTASGTEQMRLNSTGLGIGTSALRGNLDVGTLTPTSVTRSIHLGYSAVDFYGYRLQNTNNATATAAGTFSIQRGDTSAWIDVLTSDDNGNLGIGTSSPGARLHVAAGNLLLDNTRVFQFRNAAGTARPVLTLFSDNNLYIDSEDGAQIFRTLGTERMRLDNSGNLGIGTSSPLQKLHVATAGNNYIVSHNTAGSTSALLLGAESGLNAIYSWTTVAGSTGRPLAFFTGASEAMRLDTSGNLGLGVTPSAWATAGGQRALQVGSLSAVWQGANGGAGVGFNAYESGTNTYTYLTTNPASFYQQNGAHTWFTAPSGTAGNTISFTQAMTLFASGSLTIGGTNDSARLRVEGTTNLTTGLQLFRSGNACSALWTESGALRFGVDGSTGFTEWMQLNLSGNLGLGVTPSAWGSGRALEIGGQGSGIWGINSTNFYSLTNTRYDGTNFCYVTTAAATAYQQVVGAHQWYTAPSGTAGNTISFNQALTLQTNSPFITGTNLDAGSNSLAIGMTSAGLLAFFTNNTERARITAAGNVVAGGSIALATNATDGFLYVPTCAGTPTGTPTAITGMAPIVVDTTNNKLYFYSGGQWRDAGP